MATEDYGLGHRVPTYGFLFVEGLGFRDLGLGFLVLVARVSGLLSGV